MIKFCEYCSKEFESRNKSGRFCSRKCMPSQQIITLSLSCPNCKKSRNILDLKSHYHSRICKECSALSGEESPTWKGGYKYWSPGRFGKDKDGLSWKTQRRLAWGRDNYECQHCHIKGSRNPDVHHIIPWRISNSHKLTNLVCLCQKCHMTEEAIINQGPHGENGKTR